MMKAAELSPAASDLLYALDKAETSAEIQDALDAYDDAAEN